MAQTIAMFDGEFTQRMQEGEIEAVALILHQGIEHQFCTADGPAIQALCMLGHSDKGIFFRTGT